MFKGFWKKKKVRWLALLMIIVMVFALLPMDINWAESSAMLEPSATEEVTTQESTSEEVPVLSEENTSEEVPGSSQEDVEQDSTALALTASQDTIEVSQESETEPAEFIIRKAMNMFDTGNFDLISLNLSASYLDENRVQHNIEMSTTEGVTLPDDATISLDFSYIINNGDRVELGQEYIYPLPEGIRIDVDETLPLVTQEGNSIGNVHIDRNNQQLVFTFNENVVNQTNIPFFVNFAGGLSEDVEGDAVEEEIRFSTANGSFDYNITIEDTYNPNTPNNPGALGMTKSGNKVYVDGKPYIEWKLSLDLNGRDTLDAEITDILPSGLTYVEAGGYPKITGTKDNNATVTSTVNGDTVTLNVSNVTTYYRADVLFLTSYSDTIFSGEVTNNTNVSVANTASIVEDGSYESVSGSGNATITPSLLSKSGTQSGGVITWTVVINKEQLDVGGATYQDTFGTGFGWNTSDGTFDPSCITVNPAGAGTIAGDGSGFRFTVNETNKNDVITLTYETKITNYTTPSYRNQATLKEPGKYDLSTSASVNGYNLISKNNVSYNEVTKQLTWNITVNSEKASDVFDGTDTVTITDIFNPNKKQNKMELVSMKITNATGASSLSDFASCEANLNDGTLTVPADKLKGTTLTVTVVTEITDEKNPNYTYEPWEDKWAEGDWATAYNQAELSWNGNQVTTSASRTFQNRTPQLLTKTGQPSTYNDGTPRHDGIVNWTIVSNTYQQDMTVDTITLIDTIPEGMTYVPGSMYICRRYDNYNKLSLTPEYNEATRELSVTLDRNDAGIRRYLDYQYNFELHYQTRASDKNMAGSSVSYTNNAEFEVVYDGYSAVTDSDSDTVTAELGGVLGKEAIYQSGNNYIDWEVAINEGRFDMSDVINPVIRDELASYLQYNQNSGKLYKVDEKGKRTEVTTGFLVNVVNNELVVTLPPIGSDMYIFAFTTKITVNAAQAASLNISNTISLEGEGTSTSVSSNNVRNVSFSSSSAGAYYENELRVMKQSPSGTGLAGAVFRIYDSKGTLIASAITDASGMAVFRGVRAFADGYSYTLEETTAPDGYILNSDPIPVKITGWQTTSNGTRYYELPVTNQPIGKSTEFSIHKQSSVENASVPGATFTLYDDVAMNDDAVINSKKTDKNGNITFAVEYNENTSTTYYVKETGTPDGYKEPAANMYYEVVIGTDGKVTSVTQMPGSTSVAVSDAQFSVTNEPVKGTFQIRKVIAGGTTPLPGARFTLYLDRQCSDEVDTVTTDASGIASFTNLEIGRTYYYREVTAPTGYVLDETTRSIEISDNAAVGADGLVHTDITVTEQIENEQEKGSIRVVKTDNSTPAKPLSGAEFTLYAASNLNTPFTNPADGRPYVVETNGEGIAEFKDLPYGRYVVRESGVPTGYQFSAAGRDVNVTVDSMEQEVVTVVNDIIRFSLRILKQDDTGANNPLSGAYFVVRNSSHVIVGNGETGSDGTITFDNLPYDTYTITETRGVDGYVPDSTPQTIALADITTNGITITRTFVNHKENGSIKFTKQDSESAAPLQGAEFTLYNQSGDKVTTAISDVNGIVEFTGLPYGDYTIRETKVPVEYQLNTDVWEVTISDDTPVGNIISATSGSSTNSVENVKIPLGHIYMHFKLLKADAKGNALEGAQFQLMKNFPSTGGPYGTDESNGAPASYTAYSDADGVVEFKDVYIENDPEGTTYTLKETKAPYGYAVSQEVIFKNYTRVQMIGNETSSGIALGTYEVFNHVPGAVVPDITTAVNINSRNLVTSANGDRCLINKRILGRILITKKASGTLNTFLAGAEFTLYRFNVTTNAYEVYVQDGLVNPGITDNAGTIAFANLPLGRYRVTETKAPNGYILNSANQRDFEITESNYNDLDALSATVSDALISVSVNKFAVGGSTQLSGAVLGLYKASDTNYANCLEKWTTTSVTHKITARKLVAGEEYVIHEISAPAGYTLATEDVRFKVNANGTVTYTGTAGTGSASGTTVTMRDKALSLQVSKLGVDTTANPATPTPLSGASISIIDDATGRVVHRFTSTAQVHSIPGSVLSGPAAGKTYHYYTIHENSAPGGYALAEDIRIAIDANGNVHQTDTNGNATNNTWTDNTVEMTDKMYVNFYFAKRDKESGDALAGATFGIYKAADWEANPKLTNTNYATDLDGHTLHWVSTNVSRNVNLDIGTYYFVELKAPNGYQIEAPIKFEICDGTPNSNYMVVLQDSGNSNLSANKLTLTSRDKSIDVKFVKWSDDLQPLVGGKFSVHESSIRQNIGKKIGNSFAATGGVITLSNTLFKIDHYYAIVEDEAPAGYEKRDPMFFYIDANGQVKDMDHDDIDDNLLIFIDGTKQFGFKKADAVTGKSIAGVEMSITSEDDPDFEEITWVTDGNVKYIPMNSFVNNKTYILTETKTIAGYTYAASKTFKYVLGTGGKADQIYVDGKRVNTMTIVMKDAPIEISVDKFVTGTSTPLEGASMQVTDDAGNVLDSWVSDGTTHRLNASQIQVSETPGEYVYTLWETEAPEFYAIAQPIDFYIDRDGRVCLLDDSDVSDNRLIMYDEFIGIRFSKQNLDGEELAGASLSVTSQEDTGFEEITWVTSEVPYNLDRDTFEANVTYTLQELAAPTGYRYADSINFMYDEEGNLFVNGEATSDDTVVMVDEPLSLKLAKKDLSTDQYLAGAKFAIYDVETQKEVFTFESTGEIDDLKANLLQISPEKEKVFYCLRELEAPEGYELAKDVYFYFEKNGDLYVLYDGEATFSLAKDHLITIYDAPKESTTTTSRKTGDMSPVKAVTMLFVFAVAGVCFTIFVRRKKYKA